MRPLLLSLVFLLIIGLADNIWFVPQAYTGSEGIFPARLIIIKDRKMRVNALERSLVQGTLSFLSSFSKNEATISTLKINPSISFHGQESTSS